MENRIRGKRDETGLLPRDRAVMKLLLEGKRREAISWELGMPLGTVNTCCTRIYKQMDCRNLAELIIKCNSV